MFGGTVIGEGTYGCAVNPPFLCRGQARNERKDGKKIGKITSNTDAYTEIEISRHLRKMPLWKNYFILVDLEQCVPIEKGHTRDWKDCTITGDMDPKHLSQVTSDYGGTSMGSMNFAYGEFDFFHFMNHILEAGTVLALQGVSHYDIHRSNILIDESDVPRFLDFGMAFQAQNIDMKTLDDRWKLYDPMFDSEPPEITIITGLRKNMPLGTLINDCVNKKPVLREVDVILDIPKSQMVEELHTFFQKSKSVKTRDWVRFFKTYWPLFDSFALGAILLNVLKIQLTWPEFIRSEEWQKNETTVYTILEKMLKVSPSDRYDCVEALALLNPRSALLSESWLSARKAQRESSS